MVRNLGDDDINDMASKGKKCFCGECLRCMAKDEQERRKNAGVSKKVRKVKSRVHRREK